MSAYDLLGPADAPNAVTTRPGDGRVIGSVDTFFKNCSNESTEDGTDIEAEWLNAIIAQYRSIIRGNGQTGAAVDVVTQDNADDAMMLKSIQHLMQRGKAKYSAAGGTANTLTATLSPTPAEYIVGMVIYVKALSTNTGPATIDVNGLGVRSIVKQGGAGLDAGDIVAGDFIELCFTGAAFRLIGKFFGGFGSGGTQVFSSSGTFTVPVGVTLVGVEVFGAGGGTYASTLSVSSGGAGGGGKAIKRCVVTPGATIPVTVGLGGTYGDTGIPPGVGGTSSFGAYCSATGGGQNPLSTLSNPTYGGAVCGVGIGGDENYTGQFGSGAPNANLGGSGGGAPGYSGAQGPLSGPGATPNQPGGGASGAGNFNGTSTYVGAAGAPGVIIVRW